jgi:hypothetical protein
LHTICLAQRLLLLAVLPKGFFTLHDADYLKGKRLLLSNSLWRFNSLF